jgi:hypothetical protein
VVLAEAGISYVEGTSLTLWMLIWMQDKAEKAASSIQRRGPPHALPIRQYLVRAVPQQLKCKSQSSCDTAFKYNITSSCV